MLWPRKLALRLLSNISLRRGARIFDELDGDGDGMLSISQTRIGLARMGSSSHMEDDVLEEFRGQHIMVDKMCFLELSAREAAGKRSLRLSLQSLANSYRSGSQDWRRLFDSLDSAPRDGYLTAAEIRVALKRLGAISRRVAAEDVTALVADYDLTGDGRLNYDEFSRLACDALNRRMDLDAARSRSSGTTESERQTAMAANEASRRAEAAGETALGVVEAKIAAYLASGDFDNPTRVLEMQDLLYLRFKAKYGIQLNDDLTARRLKLLAAIRAGDLGAVRGFTDMSWDFVYPPAFGRPETEAWCRTPLCLLIRPDEGNLAPLFLPTVSKRARLELIEDVLASGCADPNFPRTYWSAPCVHACFEGDVEALELLFAYGANLTQSVEWLCQEEPGFTLVHAAAFNGHLGVLEFLNGKVPRRLFNVLDGDDSNPLHTVLESSCDMDAAKFLLEECGCDGYALNKHGRSALSMAVERLPELAATLLERKSRFEYRWWGNDLYWYSYDGIVLPRDEDTGTALMVASLEGEPTTIERLIVKYDRKQCLETPVMCDLIERKWACYGSKVYSMRIALLVLLLVSSFTQATSNDIAVVSLSLFALGVSWISLVRIEMNELSGRYNTNKNRDVTAVLRDQYSDLWNILDALSLTLAPVTASFKLAQIYSPSSAAAFSEPAALGASLLQVTLALRVLQYASMYKEFGPLLVTLLAMLADFARFSLIFAVTIGGFCNAFYALFHFAPNDALTTSDFSYGAILQEMIIWLCGQVSFDMFKDLPSGPTLLGAQLIFWTYVITCYFILLNLLIALFNSSYEAVIENSTTEWLLVRLQAMLDFESPSQPGVETYFDQLQDRSESRSIGRGLSKGEFTTDVDVLQDTFSSWFNLESVSTGIKSPTDSRNSWLQPQITPSLATNRGNYGGRGESSWRNSSLRQRISGTNVAAFALASGISANATTAARF